MRGKESKIEGPKERLTEITKGKNTEIKKNDNIPKGKPNVHEHRGQTRRKDQEKIMIQAKHQHGNKETQQTK